MTFATRVVMDSLNMTFVTNIVMDSFNMTRMKERTRSYLEDLSKRGLPLNMSIILYNPNLVSKVHKFCSRKRLGEDVGCLFISSNALELNSIPLNHVSYIVILNFNMFCPIMEHRVYRKFYTTLIVIVNSCRSYRSTK